MPPTTRRSAGSSRGGKQQSTLSFNHRVTKPSAAASKTASAKDLVVASPSSTAPTKSSPLRKHVATADEEVQTKVKVDVEPKEEKEEGDAVVEKQEEEEEKSEAELRARELGDRHIDRYWRALERERTTRRVHQEGLDVGEKVLRYWDVSSQYGVCFSFLL